MTAHKRTEEIPQYRFMLVKLTAATADALEDVRYLRQKRERRRVTKRELVEEALRKLVFAADRQ